MPLPVRTHSTTHVGLVHQRNEDSLAIEEGEDGGLMLLVCDGMGGMGRGDIASALAVKEITQRMITGDGFPQDRIRRAIRQTDRIVRDELCSSGDGLPGATAVLVYLLDGQAHVGWVGDSRAYLVRGRRVLERTRDHKLVEELIEAGQLTSDQAKDSLSLIHI